MDNEKFQELVLQQLKSLVEGQERLTEGQERIEKKLNSVYDQTAMLTEFRTETNNKLNDISNTVDFLMHKGSQAEKEIYAIRKDITIAKK